MTSFRRHTANELKWNVTLSCTFSAEKVWKTPCLLSVDAIGHRHLCGEYVAVSRNACQCWKRHFCWKIAEKLFVKSDEIVCPHWLSWKRCNMLWWSAVSSAHAVCEFLRHLGLRCCIQANSLYYSIRYCKTTYFHCILISSFFVWKNRCILISQILICQNYALHCPNSVVTGNNNWLHFMSWFL